jgi:hypothetical protein
MRRRFSIDIHAPHFKTDFSDFTQAAEHFAVHLSDSLHRKFAYQYLNYLQEVACGSESLKPRPFGRPARRLICYELERLFQCYFSDRTRSSFHSAMPSASSVEK